MYWALTQFCLMDTRLYILRVYDLLILSSGPSPSLLPRNVCGPACSPPRKAAEEKAEEDRIRVRPDRVIGTLIAAETGYRNSHEIHLVFQCFLYILD